MRRLISGVPSKQKSEPALIIATSLYTAVSESGTTTGPPESPQGKHTDLI